MHCLAIKTAAVSEPLTLPYSRIAALQNRHLDEHAVLIANDPFLKVRRLRMRHFKLPIFWASAK